MAVTDLNVSDEELERLRDKYPAWHIWMSQARRLWATRERPDHTEPSSGLPVVDGDRCRNLRRSGKAARRAESFGLVT
jgi:hypothetical protein